MPGAVLELQVPDSSTWFGKTVTVKELRFYNSHPVLFLEGIENREDAETLIKAILLIDQNLEELPVEPDAWYDQQLVGLNVVRDGVEVGSIIRVEHFPAHDMLIVLTKEEIEVMVPFVKAFVPSVDIATKTVTVTPPQGLFEEIVGE